MVTSLAIALIISQPRESFVQKIPGTVVEFKMVALPDGEFAGQQIKNLWIGETEVTWDVFDIYAFRLDLTPEENARDVDAENRPSRPYGAPDRGFGHKGYAALSMSIHSATKFCEWLSKKTGKDYRLPTDAEWEYAARAGATSEPSQLGDYAWFWDDSNSVAHPVATKKPNAWGLYDMLGNTSEWVSAPKGGEAAVRGGNFYSKAKDVKFTTRQTYDPVWQLQDAQQPKSDWWYSDGEMIGMRVVCEG
ncbi:MAG TPA: SUMF1/EgtB/PvdO family nonheme iron enzyme [Fimbriimonadaceae bacterium]|nr:SUMF1/EgtB/PvdO family nonheme iron enzyme [Fimbriimonadaceae bacterium]